MIKKTFPRQQEFFQNPFGYLSAVWIILNTITASLIPRATVITLTLLGTAILVHSLRKRRIPPLPNRLFVSALVSILVLACLSVIVSIAPDETFRRIPRLSLLFLWGILALAAVQQASAKIADWAMAFTTVAFTIALITITVNINFDYTIYRTLTALFKQTAKASHISENIINQPALLLALYVWPVSLALWLKRYRLISIACIALTLTVFAFSKSESVTLALFCGILACCFTAMFPRLMKVCFSVAIVGLMIAMPVIPQLLQSFFEGHQGLLADSGLHRLEIWSFTAGKISEHPILGYGLEASRILGLNTKSTIIPGASLLPLHPHNGFLQIWLELGLAGYVFIGLLCLWITHKISLLKGAGMAFSAGLFICGLSLFTTAFGVWQSWIIAVEFAASGALLLTLKLSDGNGTSQGQTLTCNTSA